MYVLIVMHILYVSSSYLLVGDSCMAKIWCIRLKIQLIIKGSAYEDLCTCCFRKISWNFLKEVRCKNVKHQLLSQQKYRSLFSIKQISHDEVTLCPVFSMRNNPKGWVPSQEFFHFRENQMCVWWLKHCQGQAFDGTFSPTSLSSSSRTVMGIGINISRTSSSFTSLQV